MRVLLTGATGFLGSHVAELLLKRGDDVIATIRKSSNTTHLKSIGATLAEASLESGDGLDQALDGVDAVIHCAGGGQVKDDRDFVTQNLDTTRTLLRAIERVRPNIRRFVHASSISAIPALSKYGAAKQEAERAVLDASRKIPTTLLRLPALYGPRDSRWVPLYKAARVGVNIIVGEGPAMSLLYATDAASSMVVPLDKDHPSGSIYAPEDGTPVTQRELGRAIARVMQRRTSIPIVVPGAVLRAAATVLETANKIRDTKIFLSHDKLNDMLASGWVCDSGPLRRELGWASRVALDEGAELTAAWYRRESLI